MPRTNPPPARHRRAGAAEPAHPADGARAETPPAATERGEETNGNGVGGRRYAMQREGTRRIRLHAPRQIANDIDEAVVKKVDGKPDLRFAENRLKFLRNPANKRTGQPDFRFVENRPDILAIHEERGETLPNVLFDEEGEIEGAGEEIQPGEEV